MNRRAAGPSQVAASARRIMCRRTSRSRSAAVCGTGADAVGAAVCVAVTGMLPISRRPTRDRGPGS